MASAKPLVGKTALVTGGSRGIGREACRLLAEMGCGVAFSYNKNKQAAEEVERMLGGLGVGFLSVKADVSKAGDCEKLVASTVKRFRKIDFLVNNAGVLIFKDLAENSFGEIDYVIDTNLKSQLYLTKIATPYIPQGGVIVNLSSGLGKHGMGGTAAYSASKFGVIGLTESSAEELAPNGIRVYAVCPGGVKTEMYRNAFHEEPSIEPVEIAQEIARLCLPDCREPSGKSIEHYASREVLGFVKRKLFGSK